MRATDCAGQAQLREHVDSKARHKLASFRHPPALDATPHRPPPPPPQPPPSLRGGAADAAIQFHRWERQRILDLFAVLDWMMRLPEGLEDKLWQDIEQIEGERKMPYVTSVERRATERGIQQGMQQGIQQGIQQGEEKVLERLLTRRFGPLSEATRQRLRSATLEQLERWTDNILDAATLENVFKD
ncbi:DUF4351 domain-containing protein [Candidatus Accumulibacter phosphatis]|uniref:DUF4351 domain-containing protein n=1 Tax=Candidatus Accumulibacter phosphatis TaxID=327160 RepID=A0ABX1TZM2_9PROT|nr:DUF4351 domain-containing protein [Candidatus Accumulibacter phosphatis]NMQ29712.1 DUF4351 domain-containing protein [Candidatus Accumulibacter phosphatis]